MAQKILMEKPVAYERNDEDLTLTKVNDGWVTDGETFTRLLRKETFYYMQGDNGKQEDPERPAQVVLKEIENIKGTMYLKRKLAGTLFDDVQ